MNKFWSKIGALLLCTSMFFVACESDDPTSTGDDEDTVDKCGDVSDKTKEFYEDDAFLLALNATSSSSVSSVLTPPALVERMSDVLTAIHASDFAARDSVIDVYDVHIHQEFALDRIWVTISTDSNVTPWGAPWINGDRFTSNPTVDDLLVAYDLQVAQTIQQTNTLLVELVSEDLINTQALADQFAAIEGVENATVSNLSGDGDNITVMALAGEADAYEVTYDVAYDDCENTCLKHRYYTFRVSENCSVTYIKTEGDEAPELSDRD